MSPEDVLKTEFSDEFVQGMRNRMLTSYFKYGRVRDSAKRINFMGAVIERMNRYEGTANREWLIDAANYLMMEFMFPSKEGAYFRATSAEESPGQGPLKDAKQKE